MAKAKEKMDFTTMLMGKLKKAAPKSEEESGVYEISMSTDCIMSEVKYTLFTGNAALDDIMGGFPFGRIAEVYGLESSGKTALAIRCAVKAQTGCIYEVIRAEDDSVTFKKLKNEDIEVAVLYIDNEGSLDSDKKIEVDGVPLNVITSRCDTIDMVFKQLDVIISAAEERTKEEDDGKLRFLVAVVDTIASTSSKQELSSAWGKQDYARQPQLISEGFRIMSRRISRTNACIICTNQVRMKMEKEGDRKKGGFSSGVNSYDFNSFGGMALRYYASHRLFINGTQSVYKLHPSDKFPSGLLLEFKTVKNRIKMPLRRGRAVLLFDSEDGGLSSTYSMLETLVFLKYIEVQAPEKGTNFVCRFGAAGIKPVTFDNAEPSMDDLEEKPTVKRRKKNLGFMYRCDWPPFYEAHKEDLDLLWDAAIKSMFIVRKSSGIENEEDADEDDNSEIDV